MSDSLKVLSALYADDMPPREDAEAALRALYAGAYGPKGGRRDYMLALSTHDALVLTRIVDALASRSSHRSPSPQDANG